VRCVFAIALVVAAPALARADGAFSATAGAGLNVGTPFFEGQLARRFVRAPHVELYLDYSYDRPISELSFQTFGVGVRTYFAKLADGDVELYHQALAGFALSSSGKGPVQDRSLGERLLGGVFEQGVGVAYHVDACWAIAATASVGYPVYLRSDLAIRWSF
jgi:hypothetical protein